MNKSIEAKRVNRQFATSVGVGGLPASQMLYWAFWGSLLMVGSLFFEIPTGWFIALLVCPLAFIWVLTGSKQWKFYERFGKPFQFTYGKTLQRLSDGLPVKTKAIADKKSPKNLERQHFEKHLDLITYVEFRYQNQKIGAYLSQGLDPSEYQVVFAFKSPGRHCIISVEDALKAVKKEDRSLRHLPPNSKLKFVYSIKSKDRDRQLYLTRLAQNRDLQPLERELVKSQKQRVRKLTTLGVRKVRELKIYGSLKLSSNYTSRDNDLIGRSLKFLESKWEAFSGKKESAEFERVHQVLRTAYTEGYRKFSGLLRKMDYRPSPLSADRLWEADYSLLHSDVAPPLPLTLVVDESGMRLERNQVASTACQNLHVTSLLSRPERGQEVYPKTHKDDGQFFYLPRKQLYVGFMQICPPDSYGLDPDGRDQLNYLWQLQSNPSITNCEFVTEFSPLERAINKFSLERNTRFYKGAAEKAQKLGTVDVNAEELLKESIEARKMMAEGQVPIAVGCGLFLYRKSTDSLTRDFEAVANDLPQSPTERAWFDTMQYWLESLPFTCTDFLTYKGDRRDRLASSQAPGMKGCILPKSQHEGGIEFIASEGGSPINVNPFKELMHWAILATSRGGKSVVLEEIILIYYLMNMTVVGFDFPGPDGKSTFTDTVEILESLGASCCYINILEHSCNPLDLPDLRKFASDDLERQKREQVAFSNHLDTLKVLVLGVSNEDATLEKNVNSLISQSLAYFHDLPEIKERYLAAQDSQPGQAAWENTPTIQTFLKVFEDWAKQYILDNRETISSKEKEAVGLILSELRAAIKGSLGKAIAYPSSFNTGSQVTIFALTNVTSDADAAVLVRIGYNALVNRSLEVQGSAFILDEMAILLKFKSVAQIVAQIIANGLKWGVRVIISAQNIDAIVNSLASADVMSNVSAWLIGYIRSSAKEALNKQLGIPMEYLDECANEDFMPSLEQGCSHWLLAHNNILNWVDYYPPSVMLALSANNPDEREARKRYMDYYSNSVESVLAFTQDYVEARQKGLPMSTLSPGKS